MSRLMFVCLVVVGLALLATLVRVDAASNISEGRDALSDIISELASNPRFYISTIIQFIMGFLVGYFSFKAIRYILAIILTLVIGSFLSVWSLGDSITSLLNRLYPEVANAIPYILTALQMLGITTVGPIAVGFIIGALVGLIRG